MSAVKAVGRVLQSWLGAWLRWVRSRRTLAGKASALTISLFALCCSFAVFTAPFAGEETARPAVALTATPRSAAMVDAPAQSTAKRPSPTFTAVANTAEPTKTPEPPIATQEVPTAVPTAMPPTAMPPTAEPIAQPVTQPNNPGLAAPPLGNGGNTENAFSCIGGCAEPPDPSCAIKGNVNSEGERIFHMPGGSFYERTDIKPEEGDAWFCSIAEAEAADFRASER